MRSIKELSDGVFQKFFGGNILVKNRKGGIDMRRWNKISVKAAAGILTALMITAPAVPVHATTGWNVNSTGWWWEESDGSYPAGEWKQINGTWYYFDGDGYMATGWRNLGGTWYYMDGSGAMATGWREIGSTWYYFYGSGAMASDTTVDGYYLNSSGAWVENTASNTAGQWVQSGNRWWYKNADGSYPSGGWKEIGGTWYLFDKNGWMLTGWQTTGGNWYYMDESGAMLTGWQKIGNDWYCLESDGHWNVNAGNNPDAEKPSSGGSTTAEETPEHVHDWQKVYTTVEHPAETHTETVCTDPGATWPVYEEHTLCDHCLYDFTANKDTNYGSHICADGTKYSTYGGRQVIVDYVTFPPTYAEIEIIDKEAWTEQIIIGYTCICGASKEAE